MSLLDWIIVVTVIVFITYCALTSRKYSNTVAGFLSANRCAGRYLLSIAQDQACSGAISIIVIFELFYQAGFGRYFWGIMSLPITMLIAMSGWVMYRYRQTRALTLAQFFEMRYGRKFRIFAGILIWISGILNFGIFPGVTARFFINFCGFPPEILFLGITIPTFPLVSFLLVALALFYIFIGGQISVLVTDFWQGIITTLMCISLILFLAYKLKWSVISESLLIVSTPGQSRINPFDISSQKDFNIFFYIIGIVISLYSIGAWQGNSGYFTSALTAHEAKMAGVINQFKGWIQMVTFILLPLTAIVLLNHPTYRNYANEIVNNLNKLYPNDVHLQTQMQVPAALRVFIPTGLSGFLVVIMLGFGICNMNSYMHSWGTIFVQDVICPVLKKPLSTQQHLKLLKLSILGVAIFSFFYSWFFPIKQYIWMYMQITAAIYIGGAGSVITGGLYWKRGNAAGAWAGMITGCTLSFSSILLTQIWDKVPFLKNLNPEFPINGQIMAFICVCASVAVYAGVSLLTSHGSVMDMDKLLHRGEYSVESEQKTILLKTGEDKIGRFWRIIGVNSNEFSKFDRVMFLCVSIYTFLEIISFFVLCAFNAMGMMNNSRWLAWWKYRLLFFFIAGATAGIWICIGGLFDLKKMYRLLKSLKADETDDGRVSSVSSKSETAVSKVKV